MERQVDSGGGGGEWVQTGRVVVRVVIFDEGSLDILWSAFFV